MENNTQLVETLIEKASEYGKTSFEIVKLQTLDKSSDVVSSILPHVAVVVLLSSFFLFLNLGAALWIGEMLGRIYYGFFVVAGFYMLVGAVSHFFLHNLFKRIICNYIIKQALN